MLDRALTVLIRLRSQALRHRRRPRPVRCARGDSVVASRRRTGRASGSYRDTAPPTGCCCREPIRRSVRPTLPQRWPALAANLVILGQQRSGRRRALSGPLRYAKPDAGWRSPPSCAAGAGRNAAGPALSAQPNRAGWPARSRMPGRAHAGCPDRVDPAGPGQRRMRRWRCCPPTGRCCTPPRWLALASERASAVMFRDHHCSCRQTRCRPRHVDEDRPTEVGDCRTIVPGTPTPQTKATIEFMSNAIAMKCTRSIPAPERLATQLQRLRRI